MLKPAIYGNKLRAGDGSVGLWSPLVDGTICNRIGAGREVWGMAPLPLKVRKVRIDKELSPDFGVAAAGTKLSTDKGKAPEDEPRSLSLLPISLLYAVGESECAIYFLGYVADFRLVMALGGRLGY